jgi:hypothetical protein
LTDFANNIRYLAQLDPIEVKPNTFSLVDNLYETFRGIWKEEKKRMHWRNGLHHLRHGSIGMPTMDCAPDLGLSVGYWNSDHVSQYEQNDEDGPPALGSLGQSWKGTVSCEAGLPFLNASKDWVSPEVLTDSQPGQNVLDASDSSYKPAWRDLTLGLRTKVDGKDEPGADVDKVMSSLPEPIHAHFLFDLQPDVLLPLNAIGGFNAEVNMIEIDPQKASTYHRSLQRLRNLKMGRAEDGEVEPRWSRKLPVFDDHGKLTYREQSYKLYSASQDQELWCYPTSKIRFSHPRQLAEIIPVLRQHVVVWSMLRSLVMEPSTTSIQRAAELNGPKKITKRSNKPVLNANADNASCQNIDIALDVIIDAPKTRLEVFAPVRKNTNGRLVESMLHLTVVVSPGGSVQVMAVDGVVEPDAADLRNKLSRMLSSTEDPGIVLQWLLNRVTKPA